MATPLVIRCIVIKTRSKYKYCFGFEKMKPPRKGIDHIRRKPVRGPVFALRASPGRQGIGSLRSSLLSESYARQAEVWSQEKS